MKSVFTDKATTPTQKDLEIALSVTYNIWQHLRDFTKKQYPDVIEEWNFSSEKSGWSFRLKDKKRFSFIYYPEINISKQLLYLEIKQPMLF